MSLDIRFLNFNKLNNGSSLKNSIDDTDLSDFNKKRLNFYKEFNLFFKKKPELLEKFMSKYNSIKNRKMQERLIYRSILSKIKNDNDYFNNVKINLKGEQQGGNLKKIIGGSLEEYYDNKELLNTFEEKYKKEDKDKFNKAIKKKYDLNFELEEDKNFQEEDNPMQKFINTYYEANKGYKKCIIKGNNQNIDQKTVEETAGKYLKKKLIEAVDEFDNNPMNPLDILSIKNDDRIVFIAITFIIRYVTLLLVNWCVEIDIIKSFNDAFILFTFIYIIIFWLIVMIINVNISPELSGESSIIGKVQSVLYYFHFRINDIGRLLVHTLLILLLLLIPIIVKSENKINDDPLTYDERMKLYNTLSLFTIFMWLFTSIIATKY